VIANALGVVDQHRVLRDARGHPDDVDLLIAELPGINKSDLDIQIKENTVRIAGAKEVKYPQKGSLHRRERLAGRFDRALSLPIQIDADKTKAEYRDGILALFLPRAERDKPKVVKVN
jgi:HSP20 family protein